MVIVDPKGSTSRHNLMEGLLCRIQHQSAEKCWFEDNPSSLVHRFGTSSWAPRWCSRSFLHVFPREIKGLPVWLGMDLLIETKELSSGGYFLSRTPWDVRKGHKFQPPTVTTGDLWWLNISWYRLFLNKVGSSSPTISNPGSFTVKMQKNGKMFKNKLQNSESKRKCRLLIVYLWIILDPLVTAITCHASKPPVVIPPGHESRWSSAVLQADWSPLLIPIWSPCFSDSRSV